MIGAALWCSWYANREVILEKEPLTFWDENLGDIYKLATNSSIESIDFNYIDCIINNINNMDNSFIFSLIKDEVFIKECYETKEYNNYYLKEEDIKKIDTIMNIYSENTNRLLSFGMDTLLAYTTNIIHSRFVENPVKDNTLNTNALSVINQLSTLGPFLGTNLLTLLPFLESQLTPASNYVPVVTCLSNLNGSGTLALVHRLTNESPSFLRWILSGGMSEGKMKSLIKNGDPAVEEIYKVATPSLLSLANHSDPYIRSHTVRCLPFYVNDPIKVSSVLRERIQTDFDDGVRIFSILVLGNMYVREHQIQDPEQQRQDIAMIEKLTTEKGSKNEDVRKAARSFISQLNAMNEREKKKQESVVDTESNPKVQSE